MSLLTNLSEDLGETVDNDSLGGNYTVLPTGAYKAKVEHAILSPSKQENSKSVTAIVKYLVENPADAENPVELTKRYTIIGVDGKNTTTDQKTKKVKYLFGYEDLNTLALVTVGKPLTQLTEEVQLVEVYDSTTRKKEPTEVTVIKELEGQELLVLIQEQRVNKQVQVGTKWEPTNEDKQTNAVVKTVHVSGKTLTEARDQVDAAFVEAWKEKYAGKIVDKFKTVTAAPVAGVPGGAPTSSGAKALF